MLKKLIGLASGLALIGSLIALSACSQRSDLVTLRLAHTLDAQHPVHQAMVYMNERLQKHSKGSMQIAIYPSGQLGSEREVIELLQIGSLSMTKVSASSIEAFVPQMKIFSLPYLFSSQEHLWRTLNGDLGKELLDAGIAYRIRGLGYFDAGSRSFYSTKKPIHSPADLKGMKVRVLSSQSAVEMIKAMGGSATPISWGELYTSLQQGVVDAAENNLPSFYLSKHYEVCKYLILDEHTSIPDVMIISNRVWEGLSAQQQQWLALAMQEATEYQRSLWQEASDSALAAVKAAGVTVVDADKSQFKASVTGLLAQQANTDLGSLIQRIKQDEEQ
jgi:tripartite ATP-independent transporter DctP family solute receptor